MSETQGHLVSIRETHEGVKVLASGKNYTLVDLKDLEELITDVFHWHERWPDVKTIKVVVEE